MHDPLHFDPPRDQADGLRRLFAQSAVRLVPVVANPQMAFAGVLLERLCSALVDQGARTLVVDAADSAPAPDELAVMSLAGCIEPLSPGLSYLAARTLPLRHVDAYGSMAPFLQAVVDAAPDSDVVLVHAEASDLARLFARQTLSAQARPVLLADDHPASVTHAYAAMKLLALRAQLMVFDLLLGAAPGSPRAPRIAAQLASCADTYVGALLHDWALVDPAGRAAEAPTPALQRLVRSVLQPDAPALPAAARVADGATPARFVPPAARRPAPRARALN